MAERQSKIEKIRHSLAHLLAMAVLAKWPQAKLGVGPVIENGFYYDFLLPKEAKPKPEDLKELEEKMRQLIAAKHDFKRKMLSLSEAKQLFRKSAQEFKLELLADLEKYGTTDETQLQAQRQRPKTQSKKSVERVSLYQTAEFIDLCRGGHVKNTKEINPQAFCLTKIAGAYWRGKEDNPMLTRFYGLAFETETELKEYLKNLELAERYDHRKIGREQELFLLTDEVGPGLTLWLPNGATIRREIENFQVQEQIKLGYQHVYSPHIGRKALWQKSGHWDLYREKMYSPMSIEGEEYLVKPMTCPMHIQSYKIHPRSYKELPLRIAEVAAVYRYEQSGELNGLLRVRAFTQDDAHIFCTPEQAIDEFLGVFQLIQKLYRTFGFSAYRVRAGFRSPKEKYLGSEKIWRQAEKKLVEALKQAGTEFFVAKGDAAFYGPKADFLIKDALGREWQCGTVQIDFMLPERFGLRYIDKDGKEKVPVMIHRAPLGSLERFLAILIEHYAGAFPLWLAPLQVVVMPLGLKQLSFARKVLAQLEALHLRAKLWDEETISKRIRLAELRKIPYILVVGDKEVKAKTVAVRQRGKGDLGAMKLEAFLKRLRAEIEKKVIF